MANEIENPVDLEPTEKEIELSTEIERLKAENEKLKKATTNASADASKYKKELAAKMTEQEKADAEKAEVFQGMKEELEALRKDKTVSEHTAEFLSIGMSDALAKASAVAMADNNMGEVFKNFKSFLEEHDKNLNADAIRKTPTPGTSKGEESVTKEQFMKMNYRELVTLKQTDPDLYEHLKNS